MSRYKFGSGGQRQYYFALSQIVNEHINEFLPTAFEQWKSEITKEEQEKADKDAKWTQDKVHGLVVEGLREIHGDQFFDYGISSTEIKLKAHGKRMSEEDKNSVGGPEKYLDFLDLRKMVEQKENWQYFENMFNIRLPAERKGIAKYLKWFDEINRIRKVSAHPYQRKYSNADVEILKTVMKHISENLPDLSEKILGRVLN